MQPAVDLAQRCAEALGQPLTVFAFLNPIVAASDDARRSGEARKLIGDGYGVLGGQGLCLPHESLGRALMSLAVDEL